MAGAELSAPAIVGPPSSGQSRNGNRFRTRRGGQNLLKPLRQVIESVNWTFNGQWTWNDTAAGPLRASWPGSWR